jgi:hypothetical protein
VVFITEVESVYSVVHTESLYEIDTLRLWRVKEPKLHPSRDWHQHTHMRSHTDMRARARARTHTHTHTHTHTRVIFMKDQKPALTHLLQCRKFTPLLFVAILGWWRRCSLFLLHCCSCCLVHFFVAFSSWLLSLYFLRGTGRLHCCVHNSSVPTFDDQIFLLWNKEYTNWQPHSR